MRTQPGWTWLPGKRAWEHCPWILRLPRAPPSPHSPLQPQLKACRDCLTFTLERREVLPRLSKHRPWINMGEAPCTILVGMYYGVMYYTPQQKV